ncbi:flavin-containing monooxygenase [Nocardioides marmorisolisilvae]|nr:NAD(P)/FAD-dependent oxidoreductase [Nocardioides marmorisolisilvae]
MDETFDVVVVGAGVSGMAMGLALQETDRTFVVLEKAGEVGGTWRENRYPGLTIDVPAAIYTYSGHRNPDWTRFMPGHREILEYHRDVSIESGLREHIRFNAEVVSADWTGSEWVIATRDGATYRAPAVVFASGFLHHPAYPSIPGLETFAGETVHSACWRDDIVVEGRRVGVIGNGSTGIQLVSALSGVASHLTSFQRTAQWVFPLPNFDMSERLRRWFRNSPQIIERTVHTVDWIADRILGGATVRPGIKRKVLGRIALKNLNTVKDPELRAKLTPTEKPLCRRPIVSTRFYKAVQHPDVEVCTAPISEITPAGVVTEDGTTHELDVLILATGFRAHDYMRPIAVTGVDGVTLDEAWADGPYGYTSIGIPGFPNLFMVLGPHSPLVSISIHGSAELQSRYILQVLDHLDEKNLLAAMPTTEAAGRWLDSITAGMPDTIWATGCHSWYVGEGTTPVLWPYDLKRWREVLGAPVFSDYEFVESPVPAAQSAH